MPLMVMTWICAAVSEERFDVRPARIGPSWSFRSMWTASVAVGTKSASYNVRSSSISVRPGFAVAVGHAAQVVYLGLDLLDDLGLYGR